MAREAAKQAYSRIANWMNGALGVVGGIMALTEFIPLPFWEAMLAWMIIQAFRLGERKYFGEESDGIDYSPASS